MNAIDYQQACDRTLNHDLGFNQTLDLCALGIAGEGGEIVDIVKKYLYHGHDFEFDDLVKEIGDLLWYIATLCTELGYPLETVFEMNIAKLKKRYPHKFDPLLSQNREEYSMNVQSEEQT